jgi:hypothetical protein
MAIGEGETSEVGFSVQSGDGASVPDGYVPGQLEVLLRRWAA